jgi:hypothetical protein
VGQGAIYSSSTKQKIVFKSSTETELLAISDGLGQVIWVPNLLLDLGYMIRPAHILQDNRATMAMIANNRFTCPRTRHILSATSSSRIEWRLAR